MRSSNTQIIKYKTSPPKGLALKTNRKQFSANLSDNYSTMLQLYCLSKKQTLTKKELKYIKSTSNVPGKTKARSFFSVPAKVVAFFTMNFTIIKKVKQGIALVTG